MFGIQAANKPILNRHLVGYTPVRHGAAPTVARSQPPFTAPQNRAGAPSVAHNTIANKWPVAQARMSPANSGPRPHWPPVYKPQQAASMQPRTIHSHQNPAIQAMLTRGRKRKELEFSPDLDERLIIPGPRARSASERRTPARYGIGDGTAYGVGSHATYEGVSTKNGTRVFTKKEKDGVNALGKTYGCHTCGTRASGWADGHWTPDHQPPLSLAGSLAWYRGKLYPQCKSCSSKQGGVLRAMWGAVAGL